MNKIISPPSSMSDPESPPYWNAPDHLTKLEIQFSVQDTFSLVSFHLVGNIIKEFGLNLWTCNWLQMLRLSYNLATGLLGRQIGWILSVNVTGLLMCSRAMSRFRFSFQLYLGWTMISSIATIFSMPRSNLEKKWHNSNRPSNETNDN